MIRWIICAVLRLALRIYFRRIEVAAGGNARYFADRRRRDAALGSAPEIGPDDDLGAFEAGRRADVGKTPRRIAPAAIGPGCKSSQR